MVQPTSGSNFKTDVLDAKVPVLVDFWAPWCGPCRVAGPILDRVSEKAGDKAKVYKLNIDDEQTTATQFGITAIPTVMVFREGKVDKTLIGVQQEQAYLRALGL
jgi:thioredoxin 1